MPICKLCRQDQELRESHFLPAAVFAQLRLHDRENPNPVLMDGRISLATSRQITAHILCAECEERFSRFGETWVCGNMARPDGFKIQDALLAATPLGATDQIAYYSSAGIPAINMDALVYFAMSIFWRAAAHTWRNVSGNLMDGIELGPFEGSIRLFLLGGEFPSDTVILVSVWPTKEVLQAAYTPRRGQAPDWHVFSFLVPGLDFRLLTGRRIPELFHAACSHASADKIIYSAMSVVSDTMEAFTTLMRTARTSRGLRAMTER